MFWGDMYGKYRFISKKCLFLDIFVHKIPLHASNGTLYVFWDFWVGEKVYGSWLNRSVWERATKLEETSSIDQNSLEIEGQILTKKRFHLR